MNLLTKAIELILGLSKTTLEKTKGFKTYTSGGLLILFGVSGFLTGSLTLVEAVPPILVGLGLIGLRNAK